MKLAELLAQKKDISRSLDDLRARISTSAKVQDGDEAVEQPDELLSQFETTARELEKILVAIGEANSVSVLQFEGHEYSIVEALALKSFFDQMVGVLNQGIAKATDREWRYRSSEIKERNVLNVKTWRAQHNEYQKRRRFLDMALQAANWTIEVEGW